MVYVIKYTKPVEKKGKETVEVWVKFEDRFGESIGDSMKLKDWIESQKIAYEPKTIKQFFEKNDKVWL